MPLNDHDHDQIECNKIIEYAGDLIDLYEDRLSKHSKKPSETMQFEGLGSWIEHQKPCQLTTRDEFDAEFTPEKYPCLEFNFDQLLTQYFESTADKSAAKQVFLDSLRTDITQQYVNRDQENSATANSLFECEGFEGEVFFTNTHNYSNTNTSPASVAWPPTSPQNSGISRRHEVASPPIPIPGASVSSNRFFRTVQDQSVQVAPAPHLKTNTRAATTAAALYKAHCQDNQSNQADQAEENACLPSSIHCSIS